MMWTSMIPFARGRSQCARTTDGGRPAALRGFAWMALTLAGLSASLLAGASPVKAAEPAREFLEALRNNDYFDVALDYLDVMATSPLAPASLKEVLSYERGLTLVQGSKHQRDFALREKQLDGAQTALEEFVGQQPNHQLTFSAKSELGNVIVERAKLKLERSKRPGEPQSVKLRTESTELYGKSYELFTALVNDLKTRQQQYPATLDKNKDAKRWEQRERLREDYLMAQLLAAAVLEEKADSLAPGSKEFNDTLAAAGKEYGEVFNKYRQRLAGLYARMYQGRTFQKVKNYKEALSYYAELLDNPDEPKEFHELRTKVLLLAATCWMDDSQKKYAEIIDKGGKWVEKAYPTEMRSKEMMELRMIVAKASVAYSDMIKKEKPKDPLVNQLTADARKLAQYVSRFPGDYQKEAQLLLSKLGGPAASATDHAEPKTFAQALQAGKDAIEAVQVARVNLESLPARIRDEKDPEVKKQLEVQLQQAQEGMKTGNSDALEHFRKALKLVDKDTTLDDVNIVRYYLTYLYYAEKEYFDAAVVGEFVAVRYPDAGGARQCAKIAMASFLKMYGDAKTDAKPAIDTMLSDFDADKDGKFSTEEVGKMPEEKQQQLATADLDKNGKIEQAELLRLVTQFESEQIIAICNYITSKWPDQPEAQEALSTLIAFMISENQLDKAQEYLSKIPEDSPQRGAAELKLGQALWGQYLRGMHAALEQEKEATEAGALDAALKAQIEAKRTGYGTLKTKAEATLTDGVSRMEKSGKVDKTMASAVLSLGQIYVDTNQPAKAVELFEKPNVGALTLVTAKHEAVDDKFTEETYKTALRAYISALASATDSTAAGELIKKAESAMAGLKGVVPADEAGQRRLVAIYYSLARDLETQMELADPKVKSNLAKGFETFLNQVRSTSTELNVLYWVATTFSSMGSSYGLTPDGKVPEEAKRYFGESAKTFQDILSKSKAGTIKIEPQLQDQISLQLAKTLRDMGDFDGSIKLFTEILKKSNMLLSVQTEAARTYEMWAERSGDPKYFVHAIQGNMDNKTRRSTIWGWMEVAKITAGKPQFRDTFYESRYHVSLSRFKFGQAQKTPADVKKHIEQAETSLAMTYQLYPNIDGDQTAGQKSFREMFDTLAKSIQKSLNKPQKGLAAMDRAMPGDGKSSGGTPTGMNPPGAAPTGTKGGAAAPATKATSGVTPAGKAPTGVAPAGTAPAGKGVTGAAPAGAAPAGKGGATNAPPKK